MKHWQQETGLAISRRILVASMACVAVWQLQRDDLLNQADVDIGELKKLAANALPFKIPI